MRIVSIASISLDTKTAHSASTNFEKVRIEQTRRISTSQHERKIEEERRQIERQRKQEALRLIYEHHFEIDPYEYARELSYRKHLPTKRYYCQVINVSTEEVIREVPPEEQLDRIARWRQFIQMLYGRL